MLANDDYSKRYDWMQQIGHGVRRCVYGGFEQQTWVIKPKQWVNVSTNLLIAPCPRIGVQRAKN